MPQLFAWMLCVCLAAIRSWVRAWFSRHRIHLRKTAAPAGFRPSVNLRKPGWVRREVIRLCAWSPDWGCRKIADAFNRQFATTKRMTVGKSYVASVLRASRSEIVRLRRTVKHRVPRNLPRHKIWAMDLSTVTDATRRQRLVLGLIDHGTQACLCITDLTDKRSLTILRELVAAFRRFGIPRVIRTDNEACFTSQALRGALIVLGIRSQRTDTHCPWQNGRIERLFGTFKACIARTTVLDGEDLRVKLIEFRAWYNHARPHQHLDMRTPAEAWNGMQRSTKTPRLVRVWDGDLAGWYFPP